MIQLDCERLRAPFNGFYTYTLQLALALVEESRQRNEPLKIYCPSMASGIFPDDVEKQFWHHTDKYLMPLSRNIHLYHCTNQLSRYIPRSFRVPVVQTVHDLNYRHLTNVTDKFSIKTTKAVRNASHIIAISNFVKEDIVDCFGYDPDRIDVIYNGVSFYSGPVTPPDNLPNRPFILFVGRIDTSKNVQIIPSLLEGNDYDLIYVGKIGKDASAVTLVKEEAARWGVSDRIFFTDAVSEALKHWYLRNCAAFIFPSLAEGFGLPVLEALQYGKPVFCSDRTSLPEVGGDFVYYLNHDFEPRAMQEEFRKGMDAFAAKPFDKKGLEAHLDKYSWKNAARKYYDVYEKVLAANA
jgi:glycosyltransferase involved in cell wall biosynthesis